MNDFMKIIKSLEESDLLRKCVYKTINEAKWSKKTKRRTSQNVIRHFGATLIGNLLIGEGNVRAGNEFFILIHPLTNFEIQNYY